MRQGKVKSVKLLLSEPPLIILPTLASAIGLNEAIFLQQLHYRLLPTAGWYRKSAEDWAKEFPFWSVPTIRRTITSLREQNLIFTRTDLNDFKGDVTPWFSINYEAVDALEDNEAQDDQQVIKWSDQNDQMVYSKRSNGTPLTPDQNDQPNNKRYKEKKEREEGEEPDQSSKNEGQNPLPPPPQKKTDDDKPAQFVKAYERIWGMMIGSPYIGEKISEWAGKVTLEAWEYALKESLDSKSWKYLERILERVQKEGLKPKETTGANAPNGTNGAVEPAQGSNVVDFSLDDLNIYEPR